MEGDSVSVERVIAAPPEAIFRLLADASEHPRIDGSGTVKAAKGDSQPLTLGSSFGMSMRMGIPYSTINRVVEYDENRRIGWTPRPAGLPRWLSPGGRVWRFELEPEGSATRVRETWDISHDSLKGLFRRGRLPHQTRDNMEKTLEQIERIVTSSSAGRR